MPSWYVAKIKYQQELENGSLKSINETYLIDAISYTDAEARLYKIVADNTPDFQIANLRRIKLSDVFQYGEEGGEKWFKCKVVYESFDESKNKEKKIVSMMLVNADHPKQAIERIDANLANMLMPYEITDINLTPILEVHPYSSSENEIPEGFKPLSEALAARNN